MNVNQMIRFLEQVRTEYGGEVPCFTFNGEIRTIVTMAVHLPVFREGIPGNKLSGWWREGPPAPTVLFGDREGNPWND